MAVDRDGAAARDAWAATVDRMSGRGGSIGFRDYSHPVFEVFKAPRSGDFSGAHIFRYRALDCPGATTASWRATTTAAVAAAERRVGAGRVIVWTTTLDDTWTDLPLKPVYLPLVHADGAVPGAVRRRRPG